MKKCLTVFLLVLGAGVLFAQDDKLPITPSQKTEQEQQQYSSLFGVYPNLFAPSVKAEFVAKKKWTFGFNVSGYWLLKAGGKFEPFARFYFDGAPKGLYIQTKLTVGAYYEWYNDIGLYGNQYHPESWYASLGTGVAIGYQWILPKKANLVLDIIGGLQFSIPVPFGFDPFSRIITHYTYPGFPFEFGFRIGKAYYRNSLR